MKIAMLGQKGFPAHSGGVEQHVDVLSRLLAERGHEVFVYARRSYCGRDARSGRLGGVRRIVRPSIATKHLDAITGTLGGTIDVALRRADVVHYHAIGPAALVPLARLAGLPVVVTVHGLDWQRVKWGRLAQCCLRFGEWTAAHCANELVVVSPVLREYFATQYGVEAQFVPNGVVPPTRRAPGRMRQWNLEPGEYVLAVARLVPEKGLHYLTEAMARVPGNWKLVIAGGGGFDADYERRLRASAGPRVVFTGPADRELLAELYSHARLFVLPSDLEGMSIALLEAMSARLPVLVSDVPENSCVVGRAGFTFRAGDVDDLSQMLRELLTVPDVLAQCGVRAAERVAPFRWPAVVDQLEAVYQRACGQVHHRDEKPVCRVGPAGRRAEETIEPIPAGR